MTQVRWNWAQELSEDAFRFGEYLQRRGSPLFCRIDVRLTSLEELKWAATVVSDLNKQLNQLAYENEGDPILRVLAARDAMQTARIHLRYIKSVTNKKAPPSRGSKRRTTRDSRSWPVQVGNLDRAFNGPKQDDAKEKTDV